MRAFKILKPLLALGAAIAVWGGNAATTQAQFGGLQIQIGGGGGYYGGGYGGLSIPFGVGPSIPPTSRAYMGPAYGLGYRNPYGYSAFPVPGAFGVTPFTYSSPYYRGYSNSSNYDYTPNYSGSYNGLGAYSGNGVSNYQQQLDLYQYQLRAEQSELYAPQAARNYRSQSPAAQAGNDLRPGMVLPDGSTVLSVGPLSAIDAANSATNPSVNSPAKAAKPQPNAIPTTPPPTPRRSNRASF